MKFSSGKAVLLFWYDYHDAVKNYSIPAIFINDEDVPKPPYLAPEHFDYPEWWYTWIDVDKIIQKLTRSDWALIKHYFNAIYNPDRSDKFELNRWRGKDDFRDMCQKIFFMLDDDVYKTNQWGYRKFERVLHRIRGRIERGEIDVAKIDRDGIYTPKEVAEILRYEVKTIYTMLKAGKLRGFQPGSEWRVTGQAILDLMNTDPRGVDNE